MQALQSHTAAVRAPRLRLRPPGAGRGERAAPSPPGPPLAPRRASPCRHLRWVQGRAVPWPPRAGAATAPGSQPPPTGPPPLGPGASPAPRPTTRCCPRPPASTRPPWSRVARLWAVVALRPSMLWSLSHTRRGRRGRRGRAGRGGGPTPWFAAWCPPPPRTVPGRRVSLRGMCPPASPPWCLVRGVGWPLACPAPAF